MFIDRQNPGIAASPKIPYRCRSIDEFDSTSNDCLANLRSVISSTNPFNSTEPPSCNICAKVEITGNNAAVLATEPLLEYLPAGLGQYALDNHPPMVRVHIDSLGNTPVRFTTLTISSGESYLSIRAIVGLTLRNFPSTVERKIPTGALSKRSRYLCSVSSVASFRSIFGYRETMLFKKLPEFLNVLLVIINA